jgi:hypothetical protein
VWAIKFSAELCRGVDDRVDVSSDSLLGGSRSIDDVCERDVADHQQVDITRTTQLVARGRAEDERDLDLSGEGDERIAEQVHDPEGLDPRARARAPASRWPISPRRGSTRRV